MSLDRAKEALEAAQVCLERSLHQSATSRDRLDAAVTGFSLYICDLCPEARMEISFTRYEDEDAHIWVSLPAHFTPEAREDLANHLAEKSLDFLLAEGFLILAGLEED